MEEYTLLNEQQNQLVTWDATKLFEECAKLVGKRVNVIDGELIQDDNGPLIISETIQTNCILINLTTRTAIPLSEYDIALPYNRMISDCATLATKRQDKLHGINMYASYRNMRLVEYIRSLDGGAIDFMKRHGFAEVPIEDMQINDLLLYKLLETDDLQSHVATYLGNNKILHQKPRKLSSIDDLDINFVQGVYRYAN